MELAISPNNSLISMVCIEGDKNGFVSKSGIEKFKFTVKKNPNYNLEELANRFIKKEYFLKEIEKDFPIVKFNVELRPELKTAKTNYSVETLFSVGQLKSSDMIFDVMNKLQERNPLYRIIDITDALTPNTYIEYQKANYFTNIIMVAEKTNANESVFIPRINSDKSNCMIMHKGSYRTFNYEMFNLVFDRLCDIIG